MQTQSQKSKVKTSHFAEASRDKQISKNNNSLQQDSKQAPSVSSGQVTTMGELLEKQKTSFVSTKKGNVLKGKIVKLTPKEILVDINTKANAVVLEKEKNLLRQILAFLKVGDEVNVSILNPESDFGYPVVSLRRFLENLIWQKLELLQKTKQTLEVTIENRISGGYLAATENGISGFLPNSQISFSEEQQDLINKKIEVSVLEINKETHKIIFSQKAISGAENFDEAMKVLKEGQNVEVIVSHITPFGAFVSIPLNGAKYIDGLIHISEISWDKVLNSEEKFNLGEHLEAVVIGFDTQAKRVNLSLKRKTEDPFFEIAKDYPVDKRVSGKVIKITSSGIVLELVGQAGIEGLIRKEKIPPTVSYKVGDLIKATVLEIDVKRHKIFLLPVLLEKPIGYK